MSELKGNKLSRDESGLTLVEMLVAVMMSGIIATTAITLHVNQHRIFTREEAITNLRNNTRGALDAIVRDLRMAGYNPEGSSSLSLNPGIRSAKRDSVFIAMDLDSDGEAVTDSLDEHRGFCIQGNSLYRVNGATGDSSLIAEGIDYLEFRYFDAAGDSIARPVDPGQLGDIRAIELITIGKTERGLAGHHESGTYPDGTTYDDNYRRYFLAIRVRLRNS